MKRIFKLTFIGGILLLFSAALQAQTELYKKMSQTKSIESFYYTRNMLNESSFNDFDDASFNFMNLDRNKIQNIEYLSSTKRRAIRKLKKAYSFELWAQNEAENNTKMLLQLNLLKQKISIFQLQDFSYRIVLDNKKRFTIMHIQGHFLDNDVMNLIKQ